MNMIAIIYIIGVIIALILGIILISKEEKKDDLEYGMMAPLMLLSWISVILILWRKDKLLT